MCCEHKRVWSPCSPGFKLHLWLKNPVLLQKPLPRGFQNLQKQRLSKLLHHRGQIHTLLKCVLGVCELRSGENDETHLTEVENWKAYATPLRFSAAAFVYFRCCENRSCREFRVFVLSSCCCGSKSWLTSRYFLRSGLVILANFKMFLLYTWATLLAYI